jgi:hypothetical protein
VELRRWRKRVVDLVIGNLETDDFGDARYIRPSRSDAETRVGGNLHKAEIVIRR